MTHYRQSTILNQCIKLTPLFTTYHSVCRWSSCLHAFVLLLLKYCYFTFHGFRDVCILGQSATHITIITGLQVCLCNDKYFKICISFLNQKLQDIKSAKYSERNICKTWMKCGEHVIYCMLCTLTENLSFPIFLNVKPRCFKTMRWRPLN